MSERDLRQCLSHFYAEKSLPAQRAARLSALASTGGGPAARATSGPRWTVVIGSLVVCVFVTALLTAYIMGPSDITETQVTKSTQIDSPRFGKTNRAPLSESAPRLVAVNFRADWCTACPKMAPVYDRLVECYREQSVLFVVFDLTDDGTRKQAELLASSLGIDWLCGDSVRTGTIKLVDRQDRRVLASATKPDEVNQILAKLDGCLQ